ncbi:MAG: radical SAM protein [Myxococcaceae bacterium]
MGPKVARALRGFAHPIYKALESKARVLRYLFIEITQRCNLECLHCGSDCGRDAQRQELSTEEWLAFFRYLAANFDPREVVPVVTGGEPFCCPDFDRILGGIRESGLAWGMVSNGWALSQANVDKVIAHGLQSMTVSLDGLGPSHDWLRGKAGSFERTVAGVRNVLAAGLPFFDVVTCVNPRNLGELPKVLELLRAEGVKAWRLFTIFPKGRAKTNAELRLTDEGLRELFAWIAKTRRELEGSDFLLQYSCEGYLPPAIDRQVRDEPYFCRAGINIASVLCDGAISACPNISRDLVQGNIRTDDFKQVWEDRFEKYQQRAWMKTGACSSCREWKRCQGNSMHLWDAGEQHTVLCHDRVLRGC